VVIRAKCSSILRHICRYGAKNENTVGEENGSVGAPKYRL
jgi:hypothetical protein